MTKEYYFIKEKSKDHIEYGDYPLEDDDKTQDDI